MLNHIIIIGRLTRDPELKTTPSGKSVCTFTVACDRDYKNADDNRETDFIPVVCWRGLAETCANYLSKGKLCAVEGRLQIRTYEGNDGNKRSIAEIIAGGVQFLSPKGESSPASSGSYDDLGEVTPPDDIPF